MTSLIQDLYERFLQHPVICTDSRQVTPGCLFFALSGDHFDGNQFVGQALSAGASFAVTSLIHASPDPRIIHSDDPLSTLQELAIFHRSRMNIPVIGITGTNGKTTTKELIAAVLAKKFQCLATEGNLNNHIGVPLTLLKITGQTRIAVIEMGANHPGEIARLCEIARPGFGIITNIGKAHLEGFGSLQGVISAKSELYAFLRETDGTVFFNAGDPLLESLSAGCQRKAYGKEISTGYSGELVSADPFVILNINRPEQKTRIHSNLFGSYNFYNALAAACIGDFFGVGPEQIRDAIESYTPRNNRSQVTQGKHNLLVLDAYNANPSSMALAVENFARSSFPGKCMILGDMLELGEDTVSEHAGIIRLADELGFTDAVFIGPVFKSLLRTHHRLSFETSAEARDHFMKHPLTGRTILIKGSRGIHLEIVEEIL